MLGEPHPLFCHPGMPSRAKESLVGLVSSPSRAPVTTPRTRSARHVLRAAMGREGSAVPLIHSRPLHGKEELVLLKLRVFSGDLA